MKLKEKISLLKSLKNERLELAKLYDANHDHRKAAKLIDEATIYNNCLIILEDALPSPEKIFFI